MTLQELRNKKPTETWKGYMEEDEEEGLFTEENIAETEQVLDIYIDKLILLGSNPSEDEIMSCVEKVVIGLNDLNEKYDYYIETMEREDLCEFIIKAAQVAGLETDEDITEEWRDFGSIHRFV